MAISKIVQEQTLKLFSNTFMQRAGKMLGKRAKALSFLGFVTARFAEVGVQNGLGSFRTVVRMLRASIRGEYPNLPWRMAVALIGSLLYLAAPIDIIPDFIPGLGFLDDAFLLGRIFALAEQDVKNFILWEQGLLGADEPSPSFT